MAADNTFKVTIITVVRNGEKVIQALFDSVRKYKAADVEFLILDGASTDNTVDLIKQNETIIDSWISEPDKGIYDAMNKAAKMARGQWLLFMGADDELLEGFPQMVAALKDERTIYYGKVNFHNALITGPVTGDYMLTKTNICHQAIFYPKAVFEKYQYDTRYIKCADYALNINLWDDQDFKFVYLDHLIANFPEGGFSSYTPDTAFEADKDALFKKHLKPSAYYHYIRKRKGILAMLGHIILNK